MRSATALYGDDGRLRAYHTQSHKSRKAMAQAAKDALAQHGGLEWMVGAGCPSLAAVWERPAMRDGVRVQRVDNDSWRAALAVGTTKPSQAESNACVLLARRILDDAGLVQPVLLPAEAAAAICVGLWAAHQLGWAKRLPVAKRQLAKVAGLNQVREARVANG